MTGESGDKPLVSVVLPTYDRPEMLAEAVESVAAQRYSAVELVVVDDASPTPIEPIVEDVAPADLDWRCLRHATNQGANTARNTGIDAVSGDIVAFIDDDDRWLPEKLSRQVSVFRERDEVGTVLVGQQFVTDDGKTTVQLPSIDGDATRQLLTDGVPASFSTIAVRRSVLQAAGLPDERFPIWQDREWLVRLSRETPIAAVAEPLVLRRVGDYEQISNRFEPMRDTTYPLFLEKHRKTAAEYGCENGFVAALTSGVASIALVNGHYGYARRFALKAVRYDPGMTKPYAYFLASLGGRYSYTVTVRLKRLLNRLGNRQ
jgi:glycosyltransferase involved in cell wall biosynthesis